ncbi:MAG: V-type ATP synthase subunit E family protein [bacterium]|nr:V-type ATP synthase subunit E family protein [bacterium]
MAENYEKIKEAILNFSESKSSEIIERAMKLSETKFIENKKNINAEYRRLRKELDFELEKKRTKIYSKLEIEYEKEKRRIIEGYVTEILESLKNEIISLKKEKDKYTIIIQKQLSDSVKILSTTRIMVFHSPDDSDIFTDKFIKKFKSETGCVIEDHKDYPEIFGGVIVEDLNESGILFDNSLNSRLESIIPALRKEVSNLLEKEEKDE